MTKEAKCCHNDFIEITVKDHRWVREYLCLTCGLIWTEEIKGRK